MQASIHRNSMVIRIDRLAQATVLSASVDPCECFTGGQYGAERSFAEWRSSRPRLPASPPDCAGVQKSTGFSAGHEIQQGNADSRKKQRMTALRPRKIRLFKLVPSGPVVPHSVREHRSVAERMVPRGRRVG